MSIYSKPRKSYAWQCWNQPVKGSCSSTGNVSCVDTTAAEIYDLSVNGKLVPCNKYRITDYKSVNFLHGFEEAYHNNTSGLFIQGGTVYNPLTSNINDQGGFTGGISIPFINDFCIQSDGSMILVGYFCNALSIDPLFDPAMIVRIDKDGIVDTSFLPITSFICSSALGGFTYYTTNVFADDSFIVGGVAGNIPFLVKYIYNGTTYAPDLTFTPTFGPNAVSSVVKCSAIQSDGKILVGGKFSTLNGNPLVNFGRLNADGTPDTAFNANLGAGFGDTVNTVKIQADGKILVGGNFTTFDGNGRTYIVRLNSDGTEDVAFYTNLGTGFDSVVYAIAVQADGKILVGGDFGDLDGNARNNLVRLNSDGTEDAAFYTNMGTAFTGAVRSIMVHSTGGIVVGGSFTSFDGNTCANIVKLDSAGNEDAGFTSEAGTGFDDSVFVIKELPNYGIGVGGLFKAYAINVASNFMGIVYETYEYPYNGREVYTSPDTETIIVTASTEYDFEPIAYSEQYPQDILYFLPWVNKLGGEYLNIYNNATLPNGDTVTGFDLQWNGTNAYFTMPEGYPALFGYVFYIYMESVNGGGLLDWIAEPLRPGICEPNFGYYGYYPSTWNPSGDPDMKNTRIKVSGDGMTVTLLDFTYDDFLKYEPDSLSLDSIAAIAPAYGWMARRHDTTTDINVPFDYKNFKYRRYQSNAYSDIDTGYSNEYKYYNYKPVQSVGPGSVLTTNGSYKDFYSIDKNRDYQGIYIEGYGVPYSDGWYNGYVDNNVFADYCYDFKFYGSGYASRLMNNTFIGSLRTFKVNNVDVSRNIFGAILGVVEISNNYTYNTYFRDNFIYYTENVKFKGFENCLTYDIVTTEFNISLNYRNFIPATYLPQSYTKSVIRASDSGEYIQYSDGTAMQFVTPITS